MKQKAPTAGTDLSGKLSELDAIIESFRVNAFRPVWQQSIDSHVKQEETRINNLVVGSVGGLEDRIYVASNADRILVFTTDGDYLDYIELEEGLEVNQLLIIDIDPQQAGNELLIHNSNDTILFYTVNAMVH